MILFIKLALSVVHRFGDVNVLDEKKEKKKKKVKSGGQWKSIWRKSIIPIIGPWPTILVHRTVFPLAFSMQTIFSQLVDQMSEISELVSKWGQQQVSSSTFHDMSH